MMEMYGAVLSNIVFILVGTFWKNIYLKNICKAVFVVMISSMLFPIDEYHLILIPLVAVFVLSSSDGWEADALMMSIILIHIYLLLKDIHYGEFISFMSYIIATSAILSKESKKIYDSLRPIFINISFYVLASMAYHLSSTTEMVFLSLVFFNMVLIQCIGISPFHSYRDNLSLIKNKLSLFKIDMTFVLFVFPIHLKMFNSLFSLVGQTFQDIFLSILFVLFFLSLYREYTKKESDFDLMANVKIVIISIMLINYLGSADFYYMAVPFLLVHYPLLKEKKEFSNLKNTILNYLFFFLVLGLGPSAIFKVKTHTLLLIFHYNKYFFFFFILSTALVIIRFMMVFVGNTNRRIFIKNPLYFTAFFVIICVYLFSGYIPDKI